jgi:hypothetical protein
VTTRVAPAKRLRGITATIGLAIVLALATAPASARPDRISCGAVITADTTLDADLTDCQGPALVIGADGVELDLNGHEVSSACSTNTAGFAAIDDRAGFDRVRIVNGTVRSGSDAGIALVDASGSVLGGLTVARCTHAIDQPGVGISLWNSDRSRIVDTIAIGGAPAVLLSASERNVIADSSIDGGIGIHNGTGIELRDGSDRNRLSGDQIQGQGGAIGIFASADNRVTDNSIAPRGGISLDESDGTVISRNDLGAGPGGGDALDMSASDDNLIVRNTSAAGFFVGGNRNRVAHNDIHGLFSAAMALVGGNRNLVRRNRMASFDDGILVTAAATNARIERNVANGTADDGIDVDAPGTLIRGNTADDNADLGIEAVAGVIDGGHNHASGNGNPLQCVNVRCR